MAKFRRACHVCQITGKPNQDIPLAPLHPIPVIAEAFEHVLTDCVGPLPKTKAGHQYQLTMMYTATCFPKAVPLCTLRVKAVVKALVKFFSAFGLPKCIQTDQGSNFMSKVFAQVMSESSIKHQVSCAYHPESQGALERIHQTLKSMLRKYCVESNREWGSAIRETIQEGLVQLRCFLATQSEARCDCCKRDGSRKSLAPHITFWTMWAHSGSGCTLLASWHIIPFLMLSQKWKRTIWQVKHSAALVTVCWFCYLSFVLAFGQSSVELMRQKFSDTDSVIRTPERKKKSRWSNILSVKTPAHQLLSLWLVPLLWRLWCHCLIVLRRTNSQNSNIMEGLEGHVSHLSKPAKKDICHLIRSRTSLFLSHTWMTA